MKLKKDLILFLFPLFLLTTGFAKDNSIIEKRLKTSDHQIYTYALIPVNFNVVLKNDETFEKQNLKLNFHKTLKVGDKGNDVEMLQKKLTEFGYNLTADGVFGLMTQDALLNIQYKLNLDIDGILGSETLNELNSLSQNDIRLIDDESIPTFSSSEETYIKNIEEKINTAQVTSITNYYIYVDTNKQKVNIFKSYDGFWKIIRSVPCSSGKASTPTVKGFFKIESKGPMFRVNNSIICEYYTGFHGNYLFHTVLLDNNGNVVVGTVGIPLSHGCVRLRVEDAKYLHCNVPFDTTVWVE